jgi:hypothetical protein
MHCRLKVSHDITAKYVLINSKNAYVFPPQAQAKTQAEAATDPDKLNVKWARSGAASLSGSPHSPPN